MIRQHLSSLRVPAGVVIVLITEDEPQVIEGSGRREVVGKEHRETLDYETSSSSSLPTPRTSTRRRPRFWGTTSRGKMICAFVSAAAGSPLTIEVAAPLIDGSGLPPLAGNGLMLRELETLVWDGGCRCVRQTT